MLLHPNKPTNRPTDTSRGLKSDVRIDIGSATEAGSLVQAKTEVT